MRKLAILVVGTVAVGLALPVQIPHRRKNSKFTRVTTAIVTVISAGTTVIERSWSFGAATATVTTTVPGVETAIMITIERV